MNLLRGLSIITILFMDCLCLIWVIRAILIKDSLNIISGLICLILSLIVTYLIVK